MHVVQLAPTPASASIAWFCELLRVIPRVTFTDDDASGFSHRVVPCESRDPLVSSAAGHHSHRDEHANLVQEALGTYSDVLLHERYIGGADAVHVRMAESLLTMHRHDTISGSASRVSATLARLGKFLRFDRVQSSFLLAKRDQLLSASHARNTSASSDEDGAQLPRPLGHVALVLPGCGIGNRLEFLLGAADFANSRQLDLALYWPRDVGASPTSVAFGALFEPLPSRLWVLEASLDGLSDVQRLLALSGMHAATRRCARFAGHDALPPPHKNASSSDGLSGDGGATKEGQGPCVLNGCMWWDAVQRQPEDPAPPPHYHDGSSSDGGGADDTSGEDGEDAATATAATAEAGDDSSTSLSDNDAIDRSACHALARSLRPREWIEHATARLLGNASIVLGVHLRGSDACQGGTSHCGSSSGEPPPPNATADLLSSRRLEQPLLAPPHAFAAAATRTPSTTSLLQHRRRLVQDLHACSSPELLAQATAAELRARVSTHAPSPRASRPPIVYAATGSAVLLRRFEAALRMHMGAPVEVLTARHALGSSSPLPLPGPVAEAMVDLWALASSHTILRFPFSSFSEAAASMHATPPLVNVYDTTSQPCLRGLSLTLNWGCRQPIASQHGEAPFSPVVACSRGVDDICVPTLATKAMKKAVTARGAWGAGGQEKEGLRVVLNASRKCTRCNGDELAARKTKILGLRNVSARVVQE